MRLALTRQEAAAALGVSVDAFDDHVAHELKCARRGRLRLYPLAELSAGSKSPQSAHGHAHEPV